MNTTLDSRVGSPSAPSRAGGGGLAHLVDDLAVDRLRCSPPWPVAQNGQAIPQPAWLEMHTVARSG
jgi:hypothetical protein